MTLETMMKKKQSDESIDFFYLRMIKNGTKRESELALHALWNKYEKLTSKMKYKLLHTMNNFSMQFREDLDEYEGRAYEKFIMAVNAVEIERCKHLKHKWLLHIALWGYLMSMNRDIVKQYMTDCNNTTTIHQIVRNDGKADSHDSSSTNLDANEARSFVSLDEALEAQQQRSVFWESYDLLKQTLPKKQLRLIEMKEKGLKMRDICARLDIKQSDFKRETIAVKDAFASILQSKGTTYEGIANYFDSF